MSYNNSLKRGLLAKEDIIEEKGQRIYCNVTREEPKIEENKSNAGYVYVIQAIVGGPVKIGFSKQPCAERRLKEIQRMSPMELRVIHEYQNADFSSELQLHRKFAAYRKHGEWFDESILGELLESKEV